MRRFVVCYDGTWNTPDKGAKATNVVKMVRAVRNCDDAGISQIVFYDKGVGTAGGTDAIAGGGFGRGLTANVMDGYRFFGNNADQDDEIYIFGFSRGAYTARSLAGLIGLAGLLKPEHLGADLAKVMEIYRLRNIDRAERLRRIDALGLKRCRDIRVRCIGVWDTVGSLGIPGDLGRNFLHGKYYFHDVELGSCVDVALHAVAVDEKRSAFSPTLWVSQDGMPSGPSQIVEQVWFAGAHSNVGGSYADAALSNIAFDWMVKRVMAHTGLALEHFADDDLADNVAAGIGIESRSLPLYALSRFYPYQRIINGHVPEGKGFGEWFRRTFPPFDRRNIPPNNLRTVNEALHVSLLDRWRLPQVPHDCRDEADARRVRYRPVNLAAAIKAHRAGRTTPVVGWDGELLDPAQVPWPAGDT